VWPVALCVCELEGCSVERAKNKTTMHRSEPHWKGERAEAPRREGGREGEREDVPAEAPTKGGREGERGGGKTENEGRKEGAEDIPGDGPEDVGA